jgi:hypothetical protein
VSVSMTRPVRSCRTRKATAEAPECDEDTGVPEDLKVQDTRTEDKPRASKKRVRQSTDDDDVEPEKPAEVPRKKSRRVGKLARLQEMPLDILFLVRRLPCSGRLARLTSPGRSCRFYTLTTSSECRARPKDYGHCSWRVLRGRPGSRRWPLSRICLLVPRTCQSARGPVSSSIRSVTLVSMKAAGGFPLTSLKICGAKGVRTVLWALRLRACARCIDAAE